MWHINFLSSKMGEVDFISVMIITCINISMLSIILYWCLIGIAMAMPIKYKNRNKISYKFYKTFMLFVALVYATLTRGKVVYLLDYYDSIYISIAHPTEDNSLKAYTYFLNRIDVLYLKYNGDAIDNNIGYVVKWLPLNKYKRLEMILKYDLENFV